MDLLERYLQAVGRSLPFAMRPETRQDTLAELHVNLLDQLDAQQEQTGHPATLPEVEALLLRHGHPSVVASRYFPQRSLIGPELFPFYVLTLRRALPLVVFVSLIAYTAGLTVMQGPMRLSSFAAQAVMRLVPVLLNWLAIVTAVFALLEYAKGKLWNGTFAGTWKPALLPALEKAPERTPLVNRIADFAIHGLLTAFLLATPFHPFLLLGPGAWYLSALSLTLSPSWHAVYTALLALLVVQLCLKAVTLFVWNGQWYPLFDLASKLVALGIILWAILSNFHVVSAGSAIDPPVLAALNRGIEVACKLALVINITNIAWSVWKYAQAPRTGSWQMV